MIHMITDTASLAFEQLFSVPEKHSLTLSSSRSKTRDSTVYETRWFDEFDVDGTLVARFHSWSHQALKPPYRKQLGWERYSLAGKVVDREVRYSKRDNNDYLH